MTALTCEQARTLVTEIRPGDVAADTAVAIADHLIDCDDCRTAMLSCQQALSLFESVRTGSLTPEAAVRLTTHLVECDGYERTPADAIQPLRERLGDIVIQDVRRDDIGDSASRKLVAYHEGTRVQFDEPVDLSLVSPFTQHVLRATARIPYGEVRPYAWVAREIGRPRAARAVGGSLHINPAAPIIPCHRVIASDNTLGGYGGGLEMKKWLLRLEGYLK
jgi:methylated-DNA-[protein]-cysteine S-methyltransferase